MCELFWVAVTLACRCHCLSACCICAGREIFVCQKLGLSAVVGRMSAEKCPDVIDIARHLCCCNNTLTYRATLWLVDTGCTMSWQSAANVRNVLESLSNITGVFTVWHCCTVRYMSYDSFVCSYSTALLYQNSWTCWILWRQRQVWFIPLADECGVCR